MKTKPLDTTIIRVVAYVRGSTDDQQNTLVAQETQAAAYCAFKGYELARVFVAEGESGVLMDFYERPTVREMIAWMQEHACTGIIITKLDRAFKGAVDMLLTVDDLRAKGIGLHLLDLGLDPTTAVGEMVATFMAGVARFEGRRRSERQHEAFAVMRRTGQRTGSVSFGWDAVPSDGRTSKTGRSADDLILNIREYRWLLQIIAWHKEGVTDCEIARRLNGAGVKTKGAGRELNRRGKRWICDGKWSAAHVVSVRKHARLSEGEQPALPARSAIEQLAAA